jgi:hypothetical protein
VHFPILINSESPRKDKETGLIFYVMCVEILSQEFVDHPENDNFEPLVRIRKVQVLREPSIIL